MARPVEAATTENPGGASSGAVFFNPYTFSISYWRGLLFASVKLSSLIFSIS
jgi:hypothetical protein